MLSSKGLRGLSSSLLASACCQQWLASLACPRVHLTSASVFAWPSSRRACLSVCLSELPSLARASVVGLWPTLLCSSLVLTRSYPQRPYFPITFLRRYRGSGPDKFFRGTQLNSWQSGFLLITLSNAVSRLKKKMVGENEPRVSETLSTVSGRSKEKPTV